MPPIRQEGGGVKRMSLIRGIAESFPYQSFLELPFLFASLSFNPEYQRLSCLCQVRYAQTQMEKLRKTNIFSATFHIWHTGHFATINGFRYTLSGAMFSMPLPAMGSQDLLLR